jgi:hypothetical protein
MVSAVFWTWLWGAGGLLLATPLTVCLVVLGKHMPPLEFLQILLSDQPPIAPHHRFYQRLLAADREELEDVAEEYHQRGATLELFDEVILPALQLAEHDRAAGHLSREEQKEIYDHLNEVFEGIEDFHVNGESTVQRVVIVPARSEADAMAGAMLAYLLRGKGIDCTCFSERVLTSEIASQLEDRADAVVCVSALTRASARAAGSIFKRIDSSQSGVRLLGWWRGERATATKGQRPHDFETVTSFEEAIRLITATMPETINA